MSLITPEHITQRLTDAKSTLKLDPAFSGGVLSVSIDESHARMLSGWSPLKAALVQADNSKIEFGEQIELFPLLPLNAKSFHLVSVLFPKEQYSTDDVLSALENVGLRPALLEEMVAGAVVAPQWFQPNGNVGRMLALGSQFQKGSDVFKNLYGKELPEFQDPANLFVPYIGWLAESRLLRAARYSLWNQYDRFICVVED